MRLTRVRGVPTRGRGVGLGNLPDDAHDRQLFHSLPHVLFGQSTAHRWRISSITTTPRLTFSTEIRSLLPWTPPRSAAGTTNGP